MDVINMRNYLLLHKLNKRSNVILLLFCIIEKTIKHAYTVLISSHTCMRVCICVQRLYKSFFYVLDIVRLGSIRHWINQ